MKRGIYEVRTYDGKLQKKYYNYGSAYNYCKKLIGKRIDCAIWELKNMEDGYVMIAGC